VRAHLVRGVAAEADARDEAEGGRAAEQRVVVHLVRRDLLGVRVGVGVRIGVRVRVRVWVRVRQGDTPGLGLGLRIRVGG